MGCQNLDQKLVNLTNIIHICVKSDQNNNKFLVVAPIGLPKPVLGIEKRA
jgi:hypothetical protein